MPHRVEHVGTVGSQQIHLPTALKADSTARTWLSTTWAGNSAASVDDRNDDGNRYQKTADRIPRFRALPAVRTAGLDHAVALAPIWTIRPARDAASSSSFASDAVAAAGFSSSTGSP